MLKTNMTELVNYPNCESFKLNTDYDAVPEGLLPGNNYTAAVTSESRTVFGMN